MTATSSSTTQYIPAVSRVVDLAQDVLLTASCGGPGGLATLAFRAGGATFDASVVVTRERLAEYRDAINAVLVATDPA